MQKIQGDVDYQQDTLVHSAMQAMEAATNLMPIMVEQYIERKTLTGEVLRKQKEEAEVRLAEAIRDQERGLDAKPD